MLDLLIKNGKSINLENGKEYNINVGIAGGRIAFVFEHDNRNILCTEMEAEQVMDAGGNYIFPGFIDFHTHLFSKGSFFGMNADLLFSAGVTTAVDMGTAGAANYEAFHQTDIENRRMEIKTFINLSPVGQPGSGINEPLERNIIPEKKIEELTEKYKDEIRGIKVRISKPIVGDMGIAPLLHAIELGERYQLPVCVHTTNPPVSAGEIVEVLRKGDIYSHVFHKNGYTILNEDGHVQKEFAIAQKRGVILELGNGKMNFNFEVAEKAVAEHIMPNIISSDATAATYHRSNLMKDLPFVMSKMWNIGMPLHQIIRSVTETPAKTLDLDRKLGKLQQGYQADIVICRKSEEKTVFEDCDGNQREGRYVLIPQVTLKKGIVVYTA